MFLFYLGRQSSNSHQISSANIITIGILTLTPNHTRRLCQSQITRLSIDNNNRRRSSRLSYELNRNLRNISNLRNSINLRSNSSSLRSSNNSLRTYLSLSPYLTPGIKKSTPPYPRIESQRTNCPPTKAWRTSSYWIRWESECHIICHCAKYLMSDFLFSGAFSNVYKAMDLTTGQMVAGIFL